MKKIINCILIICLLFNSAAISVFAATTPPKRPIVDTGEQNISYSTPIDIAFEENSITIPLDEYGRETPYKAYYSVETDGDGEPLIRIGNMCDNGYQIYGMTDEADKYGTYIAIYPYEIGKDRLVLSSQKNEKISDTLTINIVQSLEDNTTTNQADVIKPPAKEDDISGKENKKPERPVVDTTDNDYDEEETTNDYEEIIIYEDAFIDVTSEHELYIPILTLKEAGIISGYSNGSFKPHNTITRAEACTMIINTLEKPELISVNGGFDDTYGHWAYDVIAKAKNMGIINGVNDYTFAPEDNITDEQLVKILVCLLGYGKNAPYLGGYPNGYIEIASDIGLLENVDFRIGNYTERGLLAQMIYNALNIYNGGEYELVKLPDIKKTTITQTKPSNDVSVEKDEDVKNTNDNDISVEDKDDTIEQENSIFKTVTASIPYITTEEAVIVSKCIQQCVNNGVWQTSEELYNVARCYPDEALLEEVSDIYNKLVK